MPISLTGQVVFPGSGHHVRHRGFTYIGLVIFIAIMGLASIATLQFGKFYERREAEEQLLEIGREFSNALTSYANSTPPGKSPFPNTLEDLLKDSRYPTIRRHLRKIFADPLTGKQEWGFLYAPGTQGIIGIYSLSEAKPIKINNFESPFQNFANKDSYREWQFTAIQRPLLRPEINIENNPPT